MIKELSSACGDDRVNRARRGAVSARDWEDLALHLGECPECRIAWRFARDFDGSAVARAGDERLVARATAVALAGSRRRLMVARAAAGAAAAIVLLVGVASAAIVLNAGRARWTGERAAPPPGAVRGRHLPALNEGTASVAALARVADAPAAEAPPSPEAGPEAALAPKAAPSPSAGPPARLRASPPAARGSARLFARAVGARGEGQAQRAIGLFRELQRTFPGTPEARVSLVSVGDLWLGLGDPEAALTAFDEYLRWDAAGPLAPEALNGRARALTRLGRGPAAEEARRALEDRLPGSPYARVPTVIPKGPMP